MHMYKQKIKWNNVALILLSMATIICVIVGQSLSREVSTLKLSQLNYVSENKKIFDELQRTKGINQAYERQIVALQSELQTYE